MRKALIATGALLLFAAGCPESLTDTTPYCSPKAAIDCICNRGTKGVAVCNDDGRDYGTCACVDAGVDVDGGNGE